MRFPDEYNDLLIRFRTASLANVRTYGVSDRLIRERNEATAQIATVRAVLKDIQQVALKTAHPSTDSIGSVASLPIAIRTETIVVAAISLVSDRLDWPCP